jgi:aminoglycoside 6'-N-acetyltransferase
LREIHSHFENPLVRPYLVSHKGQPFAYVQCYDPRDYPDSGRRAELHRSRGVDFLIGEADMLGRGHGAGMLMTFARGAFRVPGVASVISDPDPANVASLAALQRAGFVGHGEVRLPWGTARLMRHDRPG